MASTDSNDQPLSRYRFVEWLNQMVQAFRGGSTRQYLLDQGPGNGDPPPLVAMAARARLHDTKFTPPYYSRMQEAKAKNQVWNNDLRPLVEDRLRSMFHEENYKRMKLMPHVASNPMRRVVEDISILYESPARRKMAEDEAQEQTDASNAVANAQAEGAKPAPPDNADPTAEKAPPPVLNTGTPEVDDLAKYLASDGEGVEDEDTPLDIVMDLEDVDLVLDVVEKMVRVHEAVWVRPYIRYSEYSMQKDVNGNEEEVADPASGKLCYLIYDPSCADVVEDPDDPSRAIAWFHCAYELNVRGELHMVWHFYTEQEYWKFDAEWHTLMHEPNPLGRLPVTVFRKERPTPGCYFVEGAGRDLFEATLELCVLRTMQNTRYRDSGFKQLVIGGADEEDVPADQVMGGPTPLYVAEGGSASVLDLQPMLIEMSAICKDRSDEIAAKYGTQFAEHKEGSVPQSGFAKKLERDKVLKENKRIRKFFKSAEQDLYNNLAVTLEAYPIEGVPALDPEGKVEIDFAEPSFEEDPKDQAIVDAQELKLNKISILDILKRDNPDLTEVELIEMAERNRQINSVFLHSDQMKLLDLLAEGGVKSAGAGGNKDPNAAKVDKAPPGL